MTRTEKAVELFQQKFNCSQSVFAAFRQADLLDEATALKLGTVFGAGVACTGDGTCGAVSGALMAISMKHGRGDLQSIDAKVRTYELGRELMAEFARRNGSCTCAELLGMSIGIPENMARAQALKLFDTKCVSLVRSAAEILGSMIA
jgi:C_GCAxxG_C_C family probable redox protein